MTPERFQRISDLFEEIRGLPAEGWDRALDDACGTDRELRDAVADLLGHHRESDAFLASAPAVSPEPAPDPMPEAIGPYRIEREIGEGGMGRVYLGRQDEPIRRRVAIKLVKLGMDSDDVLERFNAERQVLALMDHPCIARIFDAGVTDRGRPWFAMEYVEGAPLLAYCDRHRLGVRERLALFVDVCRTVQHAHQKGVIHRDLKPSNVLIQTTDQKPTPKLIDFGIAKATAGALTDRTLTAHGRVMGTPAYMSPEQARSTAGAVDTRTDVFSLGVILYELLSGTTPLDRDRLDSASLAEIQRWIAEEDPPRLSTRAAGIDDGIAARRGLSPDALRRAVSGDLDVIAHKALRRDPADRYHSAAAFADDVERFLDNRPILAAPPSRRVRAEKFLRRNRRIVVALCVAVLAVLASIGAARVGTARARAAEVDAKRDYDNAVVAERNEAVQRDAAVKNTRKANLVLTLVRSMFQAADPTQLKGRDYTVAALLADFGAKHWETLKDQPDVEATLRMTFAMSYEGLGDFDESERNFQRAYDLSLAHHGPEHPDTAAAQLALGWTLQFKNDVSRSAPLIEGALATLQRRFPEGHRLVGFGLTNLATVRRAQGRFRESITLYDRALRLFDEIDEPEPVNRAHVHMGLGYAHFEMGSFQRARDAWRRTLDLLPSEAHPSHAPTLARLGRVTCRLGDLETGFRHLQHATRIAREHRGDQSAEYGATLMELGSVHVQRSNFRRAQPILERALKLVRPDSEPYYQALLDLARIDYEFHRVDRAIERLRGPADALAAAGTHTGWQVEINATLGVALVRAGRRKAARRRLERALKLAMSTFGRTHRSTLSVRANLAGLLGEEGDFREAARQTERVIRDDTAADGTLGDNGTAALHNLGFYYAKLGDPRSLDVSRRVYEMRAKRLGETHIDTVTSAVNYAHALGRHRKRDEQLAILRSIVDRIDDDAKVHPAYRTALNNYGRALAYAGKKAEARAVLVRYAKAQETAGGLKNDATLQAWLTVAANDRNSRRFDEGIAIAERVVSTLASVPMAKAPMAHNYGFYVLGLLYLDANRPDPAIRQLERALAVRTQLKRSVQEIQTTRNALGAACGKSETRVAEAAPLLTDSLEKLLATPGVSARQIATARTRTVQFFEARGDTEAAERWRRAKPAAERK